MVGVAFENVRVLSSEGYVRTAAYSAAMTVFGNYNKELYEQYGLFAYGGYSGKGTEELAEEFTGIVQNNIQPSPKNATFAYGNLYRIGSVESTVKEAGWLTAKEEFQNQVKSYLKSAAVTDLKEELFSKDPEQKENPLAQEKLALAKEYEQGKFDRQEDQAEETEEETPDRQEAQEKDTAGGNPLEIFVDLVRDGILNLVCDASRLSDGIIEPTETAEESTPPFPQGQEDKCAVDYLEEIMKNAETEDTMKNTETENTGILKQGTEKAEYTAYADRQFSSYTSDKGRTTKYGMEYLIAGKKEEKDNLSYVVNRLLGIRTAVNFTCIAADSALQSKSLATATALAGFTGIPAVIRAVQYTILLILSFEEACVDVAALLEGKAVLAVKKGSDLKMAYEEICLASRALFSSKAKSYQTEQKSASTMSYQQYLHLFLLAGQAETIRNRCYDLIQYDLRERYNQSFCMKTCICESHYEISYQIPYLFSNLPFLSMPGEKGNLQSLEVNYAYKSK